MESLIIDEEFKTLLAPLTKEEFEQLEENIMAEGCLEPLVIWNNILVDGHNRYTICQKHNIPFRKRYLFFKDRDEVIAWICANQLGRRNISDETKKYLIGKKYETEKIIGAKNARGINQHTATREEIFQAKKFGSIPSHNKTAMEMGKEYNISHNTVYKYGIYAKTLDVILEKCPAIAKKILSGSIKVSHDNLINLAKLSKAELNSLLEYLSNETEGQITYSDLRHELQWKPLPKVPKQKPPQPIPQGEIPIKQLPKYDPDAEVSSLTLTIPTWISSMSRTKKNTNFDTITPEARKRLRLQLENIKCAIEELMALTKEESHNG
ncbi:MAG: hypothetical protein GX567_15805 [Clostridia bacterium]|nr:hypothetical protein [Clostridia bacterium]